MRVIWHRQKILYMLIEICKVLEEIRDIQHEELDKLKTLENQGDSITGTQKEIMVNQKIIDYEMNKKEKEKQDEERTSYIG